MLTPSVAFLLLAGSPSGFSPQALWDAWPEVRSVTTPAPCLRHAELVERLRALAAHHRGRLALEEGFEPATADALAARGHLIVRGRPPRDFGGAQAVLRLADGYCAASDPRKDGQAAGY